MRQNQCWLCGRFITHERHYMTNQDWVCRNCNHIARYSGNYRLWPRKPDGSLAPGRAEALIEHAEYPRAETIVSPASLFKYILAHYWFALKHEDPLRGLSTLPDRDKPSVEAPITAVDVLEVRSTTPKEKLEEILWYGLLTHQYQGFIATRRQSVIFYREHALTARQIQHPIQIEEGHDRLLQFAKRNGYNIKLRPGNGKLGDDLEATFK